MQINLNNPISNDLSIGELNKLKAVIQCEKLRIEARNKQAKMMDSTIISQLYYKNLRSLRDSLYRSIVDHPDLIDRLETIFKNSIKQYELDSGGSMIEPYILDQLFPHFEKAITPKQNKNILDWSENNIYFDHSTRSNQFDRKVSPYLNDILETYLLSSTKEVMLLSPVGSGKTTLMEILINYLCVNDPGPILFLTMSDPDAADWLDTRLLPVMEKNPELKSLLPQQREGLRKDFVNIAGSPLWVGGANLSNTQGKSIQYLFGDEVWEWDGEFISEARKRLHDRKGAKLLFISQASKQDSEWFNNYINSDMREWHYYCPSCGQYHQYKFENLKWDDARDVNGDYILSEIEKSTRYQCECGKVYTEGNRSEINNGKYIKLNPNNISGRVGFHFNAMAVPWIPYGKIACEFIESKIQSEKGNNIPLQVFKNKRLADWWVDEEQKRLKFEDIKTSEYSKNKYIPTEDGHGNWISEKIDDEYQRIMSVDTQGDYFYHVIRSWRKNGTSRLISEGKIITWDILADTAKRYNVNPGLVVIDSRYRQAEVLQKCAELKFTAVRGISGTKGFTIQNKNGQKVRKYISSPESIQTHAGHAKLITIYVELLKDILVNLRDGKGSMWELPYDLSPEYKKGIVGEVKRQRYDKNTKQIIYKWEKVSRKTPNESFDCENYNIACAMYLGILNCTG